MTRRALRLQLLTAILLGSAGLTTDVVTPAAVLGGENAVAAINVGSVSGAPGSIVHLAVTLDLLSTPPPEVIGVSNEIDLRIDEPFVFLSCAANPALHKRAFFTPVPMGCQGNECTGMNVLMVSVDNRDPIPDGATLYTCTLQIAESAAVGTYILDNDLPSVLLSNDDEPPTTGQNGTVIVENEALACVGDCGAVGTVEVSNLVTGVNIDLGLADLSTCPAFDRDGDGNVRINELLQGVQSALNGCASDAAVCERTAGEALSDCVERANTAQQVCFLGSGPAHACAPDNAEIGVAMQSIDAAVIPACRDAATVRAAGYGPESTPVDLVHRLQSACRADAASLAARSFGGPQAAALATGTAQAATCLGAAHSAATRLMRDDLALYNSCLNSDTCDAAQTETTAASLQQRLADEVNDLCGAGALQGLVAVDAAEFAKRAAVQVRCLTATAHPDSSPLTLDCGPRADLMNAPRGEYVQIVLDSAKYGTRCGDGSDFAFWLRLAPEGAPVDNVVVGMQGGGVCITGPDCASRPADLFEALTDQPPTTGTMSNDPAVSPFADWTKVYLPYCNQDVFIGGGATGNFPEITVYRYGALNVRAAMRYVRDELWSELNRTTAEGYQSDHVHALFGGFSAGGFGTLYNYHYLLDDLQWIHTAAYPDAGLALDNGEVLGVGNLGVLLLGDNPPLGWSTRNYLPPYCIAFNCGVGPVLLAATSPRLLEVPEQQFLILSNQIDGTQVATTFFDSIDSWVNEMRQSYCETHALPGVQYFLPAIPQDIHVISPRPELYASRPVDGVLMRDWLASDFSAPATVTDQVEEGDLVQAFPGVLPFPCPLD